MAGLIIGAHLAAGAAVLLVLPNVAGAGLAAAIGALGFIAMRRTALLRAADSVRAIALDGERTVLELADGRSVPAELSERRYVSPFAVSLPVVRPVRRTILVAADMLDAHSFRLLRIWAVWGRVPGVAGKQLHA